MRAREAKRARSLIRSGPTNWVSVQCREFRFQQRAMRDTCLRCAVPRVAFRLLMTHRVTVVAWSGHWTVGSRRVRVQRTCGVSLRPRSSDSAAPLVLSLDSFSYHSRTMMNAETGVTLDRERVRLPPAKRRGKSARQPRSTSQQPGPRGIALRILLLPFLRTLSCVVTTLTCSATPRRQ